MLIETTIGVALLGALIVFIAPDDWAAKLALLLSGLPLIGSALMWHGFDGTGNALIPGGTIAYETVIPWLTLGQYSLSWHVGIDGISLPLILLTTALTPLAIISAWTPITNRQSEFYGLMLGLEAALLGVFVALDFFVWFIFWEAVLIPMFFMIAIWGGPRRRYAAIKFFVYTNIASLIMFIGFIALIFGLGDAVTSFSFPAIATALTETTPDALRGLNPDFLKATVFLALFIGLGVKVPIVPFHTWLPDAHVEAPTPASVILAGVLLKMGTYALLRFNFTLLRDVAEAWAVPIAILGLISIIYGALLALAQQDLKRIVAYSSISSMGYVILGMIAFTTFGLGGATFQMISHGFISGLMFMVVGVIYNATHHRMIDDLSGLAAKMPLTAVAFAAGAFAYMGLPLMSGFAAELFIFIGAFDAAFPYAPLITAIGMFGIVIVAGYLLFAMQQTLFGNFEIAGDTEELIVPRHDIVPLFIVLFIVIILGVDPGLIFGMIEDAVTPIVTAIGGGG